VSVVDFDGETTLFVGADGVAGEVVSLTNVTESEQAEELPAASVAVTEKLVVEFWATVTEKPGDAKFAPEPVAGVPVQLLVEYSLTVLPVSAVPLIAIAVDCDGEAGVVVSVGLAGGV
jgi:hypothetical protein